MEKKPFNGKAGSERISLSWGLVVSPSPALFMRELVLHLD